jgi:ketosteroid isomerase-like protein
MRMKGLLCASLILASTCVSATARDTSADEVALALKHFIDAFNNLDWDAFHTAFADDITVFNPDIPEAPSVDRLDGRVQVEAGFAAVFAASKRGASGPPYLHIVPKRTRIQTYGDVSIVTFEFDREAGSVGRRTLVFHHNATGWKIVHIHASNAQSAARNSS